MTQKNDKGLHPRNPHNERYDFLALIKSEPKLAPFVSLNKYDDLSIDFADPEAVLLLNRALLSHFYHITEWEIPKYYLCPPIPGRADYIHYIADLLAGSNGGDIPTGAKITALDIGVGANCIYPIIGHSVYGWQFVGAEIDPTAIHSAAALVDNNASLSGNIELRLQTSPDNIFSGIIRKDDRFDFTLCNPPFHSSEEEASAGTQRKIRNLTNKRSTKKRLNFGGQANELWCEGGESAFIKKMVRESVTHAKKVFWFSTLVSKKENLPAIYKALKQVHPVEVHTIEMRQGQKVSRIIAWTFLNKTMQKQWREERW
ncbi:MAG: 23S rRNA (adenine(1618)-N(6))-methyltransferase RlmF [Thiovulaceae bacterium]|nr:23S rRNA (adenine(1618)-N(6))-methyltransferase RlmF [Sulfurimonadaceae bacterium]